MTSERNEPTRVVELDDIRFVSIEDLAERWGCSRRHVELLVAAGELRCMRFGPRLTRFHPADIEAYEAGVTEGGA